MASVEIIVWPRAYTTYHADIEGVCALNGEGLHDGLDWLCSELTEQKQQ